MSPDGGAPKEWVRSVTATKSAPANVELIADVTASNGPNRETSDFSKATGGCWTRWQVYDRSNHLKSNKPTGGNILFVDGHLEWRPFNEMSVRVSTPFHWW